MKCSEARSALAADPRSAEAELAEHVAGCDTCAAYAADMLEVDRALRSALDVPVPEIDLPAETRAREVPAPTTIPRRLRPVTSRRYALAASVAGVALLAGLMWTGFPRQSLANAVVRHMSHEPESWTATEIRPQAEVDSVMSASGLRLAPAAKDVTYANSCWFRGRHVPHLVIRTTEGPVTVLVLPDERVERPVRIDESGYRGTLVPAPRGSVAVLARNGGDVGRVADRVLAAIDYGDGSD
jgi:hypothetical protein